MAAEITSREFDSITGDSSPEPSNEEGYIFIENTAEEFTFVLLHALEHFSELQDNMTADETHLENSAQIHEGEEEVTSSETTDTNSENDNSSTTESLNEDWKMVELPEVNNTDLNEESSEDQTGHNAKVEDSISQEFCTSQDMEASNQSTEEDNCQSEGDLSITSPDIHREIKTTTTLEEESKEEPKNPRKEDIANGGEVTEIIRSMKFNFFIHKHSKRKEKKKKWKLAPSSILGFHFCLPSFRTSECLDPEMLQVYESELENFENELNKELMCVNDEPDELKESVSKSVLSVSNAQETKLQELLELNVNHSADLDKNSVQASEKNQTSRKRKRRHQKSGLKWDNSDFYRFENEDDESMLEKIPDGERSRLENYEGKNAEKRLRNKSKWSYVKSHRGKRIKLGNDKKVYITMKNVYVNRRAFANVHVQGRLERRKIIATRSLKEIDKGPCGDVSQNTWSAPRNVNPRVYNQQQNNNRQAPQPRHALNRNNADNDIDPQLVQILINLQERDLMPEDYELLLRLDERVARPTVDEGLLQSLLTDTATAEDTQDTCTICMDLYVCGEERKYLPCGHVFHSGCIHQWLTNSSQNCPLDNMPVVPS